MAKSKRKPENIESVNRRALQLEVLMALSDDLRATGLRVPLSFDDFLYVASAEPEKVFRNIFQVFHDMVHYYVPEAEDDYPVSPESAGFVAWDMSRLFQDKCNEPFFSDRLFANRFMNLVNGFKKGIQNNHIYLFEGPPGSGKSTFLNNLLQKFEEYTSTQEGTIYRIHWKIDTGKLTNTLSPKKDSENYLSLSCPNNDHPISLIPKSMRKEFLETLIPDKKFKYKLFHSREYEWVLEDTPCSMCKAFFSELMEKVGDPMTVLRMVNARKIEFDRQYGKGISVFNPGDHYDFRPITNPVVQNQINEAFKSDEIKYLYSGLALTNNGLMALMDIKDNNVNRLMSLHGVISDGIHKVEHIEEKVRTLFVGLVNPEDKKHYDKAKSFQDRVITVNIPYILDYNAECKNYLQKFGEETDKLFLPRVFANFAKIVIATRLDRESPVFARWLTASEKYKKYIDPDLLILKMELYSGKIPSWLSEEDVKGFSRQIRKDVIMASENEGYKGVSGRVSLTVFNEFLTRFGSVNGFITMQNVVDYFTRENEKYKSLIPEEFITSLVKLYDYNVLQEVKEAIYFYNEPQIFRDIQNYLFAINYETGETAKSSYTGDLIEITEDYFKNFEALFLGTTSGEDKRKAFRKEVHHEYISRTLTQEIQVHKKKITETDQFANLFRRYSDTIKENSLVPYSENENFRRALVDYGTDAYKSYDERMKRDIKRLLTNLHTKFGYSENGARFISQYVIENKLHQKFIDFKPY